MSRRTLLEFNHDYTPGNSDEELLAWAKRLRAYLRSPRKDDLPPGVVFKWSRHHSEPDPMAGRGDPS